MVGLGPGPPQSITGGTLAPTELVESAVWGGGVKWQGWVGFGPGPDWLGLVVKMVSVLATTWWHQSVGLRPQAQRFAEAVSGREQRGRRRHPKNIRKRRKGTAQMAAEMLMLSACMAMEVWVNKSATQDAVARPPPALQLRREGVHSPPGPTKRRSGKR